VGYLFFGVLARSKELICLSGGMVIVSHDLEGTSNIDNMNRPELLLPVIGAEHIGTASNRMQEPVLEAEHRRRANNGSFGEDGVRF